MSIGSDLRAPIPAPDSPGPDPTGEVLTVEEAARFLKVGRNALYEAIGRGDVPHQRIGKAIRLSRTHLVRWLAGSCEVEGKGS